MPIPSPAPTPRPPTYCATPSVEAPCSFKGSRPGQSRRPERRGFEKSVSAFAGPPNKLVRECVNVQMRALLRRESISIRSDRIQMTSDCKSDPVTEGMRERGPADHRERGRTKKKKKKDERFGNLS